MRYASRAQPRDLPQFLPASRPLAAHRPAPGPVGRHDQAPAPFYDQAPAPFYDQAPAPFYDQAPAPFYDQAPAPADFLAAVLAGLGRRQKAIPSKFFYDRAGAALFERICATPDYYVTRTETALLAAHGPAIAAALGPGCRLVEFGTGAAAKTRQLLAALERPQGYVAVDISGEQLREVTAALARDHPGLEVAALCADYTGRFALPPSAAASRLVGFFPGSSIGNFTPAGASRFLAGAREVLAGGALLVGVDLKKDLQVLDRAYNDRDGVTAAFNLNLLIRINRELEGEFQLEQFRHRARYCPVRGRIEMHLESLCRQAVRVAGRPFTFNVAETIHTENSYKYTLDEFSALTRLAGFAAVRFWTNPAGYFALVLLDDAA